MENRYFHARININNAISDLSTAKEKLKTAESSLALAKDELALKRSGTRTEDIKIVEAKISEIKTRSKLSRKISINLHFMRQ